MSNKVYDVLKLLSLVIAPIGVLLVSLLNIWTAIDTAPITATIAAIETFLGTMLTISSNSFWKKRGV